jgi:hypothetical protein
MLWSLQKMFMLPIASHSPGSTQPALENGVRVQKPDNNLQSLGPCSPSGDSGVWDLSILRCFRILANWIGGRERTHGRCAVSSWSDLRGVPIISTHISFARTQWCGSSRCWGIWETLLCFALNNERRATYWWILAIFPTLALPINSDNTYSSILHIRCSDKDWRKWWAIHCPRVITIYKREELEN